METLMMYLLKMLLCSGILFGYYRVALYNERFHQWNRFYLLAALVLSVVVPLVNIPLLGEEEPGNMATIIASLPWNSRAASAVKQPGITGQDVILLVLALVSVVFLLKMIVNITRLVITYKTNPVSSLHKKVQLILTQLNHAPFSFFNWLFWRQDIDPASENGQRMLTHELTHIREHHSIDKVLTEVLISIFWINPFFWLIRRELSIVHEFLADRRAIDGQNGAAFAQMILQALHVQPASTNGLVNPFFSSQIKRRLLMITTSKEPKYSYLRRISGLVLMIFSAVALTLTIQQVQAQQKQTGEKEKMPTNQNDTSATKKIFVAQGEAAGKKGDIITFEADSVIWNKNKNEVVATTAVGEKVKIEIRPDNRGKIIIDKSNIDGGASLNILSSVSSGNSPLYIWDGKEMDEKEMKDKDSNEIGAIDVLKDEKAVALYGNKGKNGVIIITSKSKMADRRADGKVTGVKGTGIEGSGTNEKLSGSVKSVVVSGYGNSKQSPTIFIDGKEATKEELDALSPASIESMNVLKGESAIQKYGAKGKEGVIEIATKQAESHPIVFTKVEQPAQFPGGANAWKQYLEKNFNYPEAAEKAGTQGVAQVQFIVDTKGEISNVKIIKDPGNGIGEAAAALIKKGPKWSPAVQNGRQVVSQVALAIPFTLAK